MSRAPRPGALPAQAQVESARPVPEPERLARDPRLGALLEQTNARYGAGLDQGAAFRRLLQRVAAQPPRTRRWQRQGGWPVLALLATGGLSVAAALSLLSTPGAPRILLGPELRSAELRASPPRAPSSPGERPGPTAPVQPTAAPVGTAEAQPARPVERRPRELGTTAQAPERVVEGVPPTPPRATPAPAMSSTPAAPALPAVAAGQRAPAAASPQEDCLGLARTGRSRAAERCFSERASGSGLSAEMALYEVARLRRDVLHDAAGALAALREHGQRFPRGSLRNEVELSRIELLAELGRPREALLESAALLDSESGRERAAELHVLRGNVYHRDLGDPRAAAAEYAQAESRGGALGAEAVRLRGACLEALGDVDGALRAYRQYTSVPGQPHTDDVLRQIERLSPLAPQRGAAP